MNNVGIANNTKLSKEEIWQIRLIALAAMSMLLLLAHKVFGWLPIFNIGAYISALGASYSLYDMLISDKKNAKQAAAMILQRQVEYEKNKEIIKLEQEYRYYKHQEEIKKKMEYVNRKKKETVQ